MVKVTKVATTLWQRFRGAAALRPRARGAQVNFHGEAVNLRKYLDFPNKNVDLTDLTNKSMNLTSKN